MLKSHRKEALEFIHLLPEQPVLLWLASYPTIFDTRSYECLRTRMSLSRSMDDLNSELLHDEHVPVCDRLRQEQFDALIEDPTIGQQTQKIAQQVAYTQVKSAQSSAELEEIILSEDSEALKHIVCVEPVKELLEGLVKQDSLIPFFAVAFRLHLITAKTPFNSGLTEFITGVAFPRLKAVLKRAVGKPFTSGPSAVRMLLAIVADPFCAFGPEQMNVLVELFSQINHLLGSECGEMDTFYKTSSVVQQILSQSSKYPPRLIAELLQQQSVGSVSRNK